MNLLKHQTQISVEQTYYQSFQMFIKSNSQFVPFLKERDSMGRLIKNQFIQSNIAKTIQNEPRNTDKVKESLLKSEERLEYKMQKYFKHANVANLIEPSKQKKYKKTIVQFLCERPLTTKTARRPSTTASKEQSSIRPSSQPGNLLKTQSLFMPSSPKKENLFLKRANSNSTILPMRRQIQKQRKSISPESHSKRNNFIEPKIKLVENQSKYPQLSRVRKMKQLQVKLQSDFEQRHGQFLDKIIKSKQLAFEVRVGLDKIDELC